MKATNHPFQAIKELEQSPKIRGRSWTVISPSLLGVHGMWLKGWVPSMPNF